jgi:hypothetical protein
MEFFGSNNFTLFFEPPEVKTEKDPILAQLMKEDVWEEDEASLSSINEEDIDIEIPRMIAINHNDIRNLDASKKKEIEERNKLQTNEGEEGRKEGEEEGEGFSFARNRRGEEFLKMPSLSGLDGEEGKKNMFGCFVSKDLEQQAEEWKEKSSSKSAKSSIKISNEIEHEIERNFQMIRDICGEDVSNWDKVFKNKNLDVNRRKVKKKKKNIGFNSRLGCW